MHNMERRKRENILNETSFLVFVPSFFLPDLLNGTISAMCFTLQAQRLGGKGMWPKQSLPLMLTNFCLILLVLHVKAIPSQNCYIGL